MAAKRIQSIAVMTGGGDCPGLNAVIRAVVKTAINKYELDVWGIQDGYLGLIENRMDRLGFNDVSNILTLGGTILGTSNIANPFRYARQERPQAAVQGRVRRLPAGCSPSGRSTPWSASAATARWPRRPSSPRRA